MTEEIKIRNKTTGEIVTLRKKEEIGIAPSPIQQVLGQLARKQALQTKAVLGDVPFLRRILPEDISEIEPKTPVEKVVFGAPRLARDIALISGTKGLGLGRTALRGAGIGIATAETEKPEEILKKAAIGATTLPIIKKVDEVVTPFLQKTITKGIKSAQQLWQDLLKAGFTVEKTSVARAQKLGIDKIFSKKPDSRLGVSLRDDTAFLRLANKIQDSALSLRNRWGNAVGRWRELLFRSPKISVKLEGKEVLSNFQKELQSPTIGLLDEFGKPTQPIEIGRETLNNTLLQIHNQLNKIKETTSPKTIYQIIDKLDDLYKANKGTNVGRVIDDLRKGLKKQVFLSAPRNITQGLSDTENRFSEIADITDDVFDKLQLKAKGVAQKERIGAAERALQRGLKKDVSIQEKEIWVKLNDLLPKNEKFLDLYKDIFAAQDFQREGIGWLSRRLLLSPRMAASGLQLIQPLMRGAGKAGFAVGETAKKALPAVILRKAIQQK